MNYFLAEFDHGVTSPVLAVEVLMRSELIGILCITSTHRSSKVSTKTLSFMLITAAKNVLWHAITAYHCRCLQHKAGHLDINSS